MGDSVPRAAAPGPLHCSGSVRLVAEVGGGREVVLVELEADLRLSAGLSLQDSVASLKSFCWG